MFLMSLKNARQCSHLNVVKRLKKNKDKEKIFTSNYFETLIFSFYLRKENATDILISDGEPFHYNVS